LAPPRGAGAPALLESPDGEEYNDIDMNE
jgi:hypothetical protein